MLFIMKSGVPTWEDPKNRNGGVSYKVSNKFVVDV